MSGIAAGEIVATADGRAFFFAEENWGGRARDVALVAVKVGRIVDVYDVDANGRRGTRPILEDYVIDPFLRSDGVDFVLEGDLAGGGERLVVQRTYDASTIGSGAGGDSFQELVKEAGDGLVTLPPARAAGPYPIVERDAALVLVFDDLLDDDEDASVSLASNVVVETGYAPPRPFPTRVFFDAHHGNVANGAFHSTRVVIDATISERDAARMARPGVVQRRGYPARDDASGEANLVVRIPTRIEPSATQFGRLANLSGFGLAEQGNGPIDAASPTRDVLRALRTGTRTDPGGGYLPDDVAPTVVSSWPIVVQGAPVPIGGEPGFDFGLAVSFTSPCREEVRAGALLEIGGEALEVIGVGVSQPSGSTLVTARALGRPLAQAPFGLGAYVTPYDAALELDDACWVRISPPAAQPPATGVDPGATFSLRFSEPVEPASVDAFDNFRVVRDGAASRAFDTVIALTSASASLCEHELRPVAPLEHAAGTPEPHRIEFAFGDRGPTDLAGNPVAEGPALAELTVSGFAGGPRTGGVVLRFEERDELVTGQDDVRGQVILALGDGELRPRPVVRASWPIDGSTPTTSLMFPLPVGVRQPLSTLGCKMQTLWRYADLGWSIFDESKVNIDVEGLAWQPLGSTVIDEYWEDFEIRLSHGTQLPDEWVTTGLVFPDSGLLRAPNPFDANVLQDPRSPQKVVHQKGLGYRVRASDTFLSPSGNVMAPFPMNRSGGEHVTFTWRDTAVQARAGNGGAGIPLAIETQTLGLYPGVNRGSIAPAGQVPAHGLPLLMEFHCYPSSNAVGTNGFQLAIAALGQLFPSFRVHSTGGVDQGGNTHRIDPSRADVPSGGFDIGSTPPGAITRDHDPSIYYGQLDTVTRISRAHTAWIDAGMNFPDWSAPIVLPAGEDQPRGTRVVVEYRAATTFPSGTTAPFDASILDMYGDVPGSLTMSFLNDDPTWKTSIDDCDGARYLQMRVTFEANIETGELPVLDTLAVAFEE